MINEQTSIELILPLRPEFVSVARLAVSGIASRIGFDIETIEDIKVAMAEVCNKIINGSKNAQDGNYKITFNISSDKLEILFDCRDSNTDCIFETEEDTLGISIIEALMDELKIINDEPYILSISKALERIK